MSKESKSYCPYCPRPTELKLGPGTASHIRSKHPAQYPDWIRAQRENKKAGTTARVSPAPPPPAQAEIVEEPKVVAVEDVDDATFVRRILSDTTRFSEGLPRAIVILRHSRADHEDAIARLDAEIAQLERLQELLQPKSVQQPLLEPEFAGAR